MKKISKILLILPLIITARICILQPEVKAEQGVEILDGVIINSVDPATGTIGGIKAIVENILGFLQLLSGLLAVILIAVTGFRYIVDTPDVKSELKKSMIPIIVGLLLVFFATTIAKFFIGMFES